MEPIATPIPLVRQMTPNAMNMGMNMSLDNSMNGSTVEVGTPYSPAYEVNMESLEDVPVGDKNVPKGYAQLTFKEGVVTPMNLTRKNERPKAPNAPRKKLVFGAATAKKGRKARKTRRARKTARANGGGNKRKGSSVHSRRMRRVLKKRT
jgi:hypothetical protein